MAHASRKYIKQERYIGRLMQDFRDSWCVFQVYAPADCK